MNYSVLKLARLLDGLTLKEAAAFAREVGEIDPRLAKLLERAFMRLREEVLTRRIQK